MRKELVGLQFIRAAAAIMVVFDHISGMMGEHKYYGYLPYHDALKAGDIGVDLFFCLSGFIMVYIALGNDLSPAIRPAEFFKRRFTRIIPFMWVIVAAYASLRIMGRGYFPASGYARALSLFPVGNVEPGQIWTLRHEFLFYSIFALTFLMRRPWLFWIWVITPFVAVPLGVDRHSLAGLLFNDINLLFGMGVATGILYLKHGANAVSHRPAVFSILVAALYFIAMALHYNRISFLQVIPIGILSCVTIIIACGFIETHTQPARLGKILGDASYAIYLSHPMFISLVLGILAHRFPHAPAVAVILTCAAVAIPAGVAIHYCVEKPLINMCKRGFGQPAVVKATA